LPHAPQAFEEGLDEADEDAPQANVANAAGIDEIDYADEDEDEVVGGKDEV
jgi:hypothetical protein